MDDRKQPLNYERQIQPVPMSVHQLKSERSYALQMTVLIIAILPFFAAGAYHHLSGDGDVGLPVVILALGPHLFGVFWYARRYRRLHRAVIEMENSLQG